MQLNLENFSITISNIYSALSWVPIKHISLPLTIKFYFRMPHPYVDLETQISTMCLEIPFSITCLENILDMSTTTSSYNIALITAKSLKTFFGHVFHPTEAIHKMGFVPTGSKTQSPKLQIPNL